MGTVANPAAITSSSNTFSLRILVDSDFVGAIIGRSGSTIRSITQQSKARIDVQREESLEQEEKVITISGNPANCSEACYEIMKICQNEINSSCLYEEDTPDPRDGHMRPRYTNIHALHILAPSTLMGRLIGRGGASIKKIMEQTSTKIKISVNSLTETTGEHKITVVGSLEKVHQAEKLISSKLRASHFSDMNRSMQAFNQQPYMFNNVSMPYVAPGSYGIHQSPLIASMVNSPASHSPASRMNHPHHPNQMSSTMYPGTAPYLPLYPSMNVPHSAAGGLINFNQMVPRYEQERETVDIYVPSTMVGAIIGKSGAAIREMINASAATIKVATSSSPTTTTTSPKMNTVEDATVNSSDQKEPDVSPEEVAQNSDSPGAATAQTETPSALADPQNSPDCKIDHSRPKTRGLNDGSPTTKVTIIGYPASQYTAQYLIYRKVSLESGKADISLMVELNVPTQYVGKIIGRGGASVKNLQKQTRTTIRLPDEKPVQNQTASSNEEPGSSNCTNDKYSKTKLQIVGEFEGSQAAQMHIKSLIRESHYTNQNRIKANTTRNNDINPNSNSQNNSKLDRHEDRQDITQPESGSDSSSREDKCTNDDTDNTNERKGDASTSTVETSIETPPKTESLPTNCCDHENSTRISMTPETNENTLEKKSHSVETAVSSNGQSVADVSSNNNTITISNLSKDALSADSSSSTTLPKASENFVSKANDELKASAHTNSGDKIRQSMMDAGGAY